MESFAEYLQTQTFAARKHLKQMPYKNLLSYSVALCKIYSLSWEMWGKTDFIVLIIIFLFCGSNNCQKNQRNWFFLIPSRLEFHFLNNVKRDDFDMFQIVQEINENYELKSNGMVWNHTNHDREVFRCTKKEFSTNFEKS